MRFGALVVGLLATAPAFAQEMRAEEARRFVVGKLFTYNCFEGTKGAGRINADGSVAGTIQFQGSGPVRYAVLPANTLRTKGEQVCASSRARAPQHRSHERELPEAVDALLVELSLLGVG